MTGSPWRLVGVSHAGGVTVGEVLGSGEQRCPSQCSEHSCVTLA